MFLESLGTTMLLSLGRLPPCREPTYSNNVLRKRDSLSPLRAMSCNTLFSSLRSLLVVCFLLARDQRVNEEVAREEEAHGRPEEVLLVVVLRVLSDGNLHISPKLRFPPPWRSLHSSALAAENIYCRCVCCGCCYNHFNHIMACLVPTSFQITCGSVKGRSQKIIMSSYIIPINVLRTTYY
jgi:hypothetical protein